MSNAPGAGGGTTGGSTASILPGRDPQLPPTHSLDPGSFEDFTERLLNAHKFAGADITRTTSVVRWGRRGDKQNGIDFAGWLSDGRKASWQCKRYDTYTPALVREAVRDNTYTADVHHLVLSCEASTPVREEIEKNPNWVLVDKRGLQQLLEDLPRHKRREVLDRTFGPQVRRQLMVSPGQDTFVSLATFAADRADPDTLLNDLGPLAGRRTELDALMTALDHEAVWPAAVLVTGPGGRGKTRLLLEALQRVEQREPHLPVLMLSPNMVLTHAAVEELPGGPAIVVVDDAHRSPQALGALVAYARQTPGTQLVLASRPSQLTAVRNQVIDRASPADLRTIDVDELSRPDARTLVSGLATDLDLPFGLKEHLAGQAIHSPHVAVLTVSLIRRGELTQALAIDARLRERVLARYVDVSTGLVAGVEPHQVNTLLAVYAALGGVAADDPTTDAAVETLTGLTRRQHLRVRAALRDRGILVDQNGSTRVVPDVLGDDALEREAAADGSDTGFVEDLWRHLGAQAGTRLVLSLAELDWRLTHRGGGGPRVIGAVWSDLTDRVLREDLDGVQGLLGSLGGLAQSQPTAFLGLLEVLRDRLARWPAQGPQDEEPPDAPPEATTTGPSHAHALRRMMGRAPAQPAEVLQTLAPLYAQCAAHEPSLLERALDALWGLRRADHRSPTPHHDHPERVMAEVLADLGDLPDPTFPERIVTKVEQWLQHSEADVDATTALFALRPLIAKQGTATRQVDLRTLQLGGYVVAAGWARPFRDRIRILLTKQAAGEDLPRAGAGVALLGDMLQPLHPSPGVTIREEVRLAWEEDDLATVVTLAMVSGATGSGAVRRRIREQVSWTAAHAHSVRLRHEALTLVTDLDQRAEDDLAEALMPAWRLTLPDQRGLAVPTLEVLTADAAAAHRRAAESDPAGPGGDSAVESAHERLLRAQDLYLTRAVATLVAEGTTEALLAALDRSAREVAEVVPDKRPVLRALYTRIASTAATRAAEMVTGVAAGPPGPLDTDLDVLLMHWAEQDEGSLLAWLDDLAHQRTEVRAAVAHAYDRYTWAQQGPAFLALFDRGSADPDPAVRDAFLVSSFERHAGAPGRAARRLLDADAASSACESALQQACSHNGDPWGAALPPEDAALVLRLINRAGWDDWTLQHIATGIASSHPNLVLDHLSMQTPLWNSLWRGVDGLAAALETRGDDLAEWLLAHAARPGEVPRHDLVDLVLADGIGPLTAAALQERATGADAASLVALADTLAHVSGWPAQQADLARTMVTRARHLDGDTLDDVLNHLATGLRVTMISSEDGVSEELQQAHDRAAARTAEEPDADLRRAYEQATNGLHTEMANELHRFEVDD